MQHGRIAARLLAQERSHPGAEGMAFLRELPSSLLRELQMYLYFKSVEKVRGCMAACRVGGCLRCRGVACCDVLWVAVAAKGHTTHPAPPGPSAYTTCTCKCTHAHAPSHAPPLPLLHAPSRWQVPLFASLERGFLRALALRVQLQSMQPAEPVFRVGDVGHCMYFIRKGGCGGGDGDTPGLVGTWLGPGWDLAGTWLRPGWWWDPWSGLHSRGRGGVEQLPATWARARGLAQRGTTTWHLPIAREGGAAARQLLRVSATTRTMFSAFLKARANACAAALQAVWR